MEPQVLYLKDVLKGQLKKVEKLDLNIDSPLYEIVTIFMLIESVANILTPSDKKIVQDKSRDALLKTLNIKYPRIIYKIFRNPIIHLGYSNSLRVIISETESFKIIWTFIDSDTNHTFDKNIITLSFVRLKKDLISFLEKEIVKTPDDKIFIKNDNIFDLNAKGDKLLKKELKTLIS